MHHTKSSPGMVGRPKPAYVAILRPAHLESYRASVRKPNRVIVRDARLNAPLHVIRTTGLIRSVWCGATRRGHGHIFAGVWVTFADQRSAIYSAKTGRLLHERPDPSKDPEVQAEITAILARINSPICHAVISPVSRKSNSFYNFSRALWESNPAVAGVAFKDREVAKAAASVLSRQREQRGKTSVILPGKSGPLQTVAFRRTPKGVLFLEQVISRDQSYVPALPSYIRARICEADSKADIGMGASGL